MRLGTPFCKRQSETRASGFTRARFVDPAKTVENFVPVFGRNTRSTVLHFDAGRTRIAADDPNRDKSALRGVLDSIIQKVDDNLTQNNSIRFHMN